MLWNKWRKAKKQHGERQNNLPQSYASPFITRIAGPNECVHSKKSRKKVSIKIPKIFSIIENPSASLQSIFSFLQETRKTRAHTYDFDHRLMEQYDLAAEVILDYFATELDKEIKSIRSKKSIKLTGVIPLEETINRFLRGFGIIAKLDVEHEKLKEEDQEKLVIFSFESSKTTEQISSGAMSRSEIAVGRFVDHINDCLQRVSLRLNPVGEAKLGEYAGEIIDNIIEHSGENNWYFSGYLDTVCSEKTCEISLFNFGLSISESILSSPPFTLEKHIGPYLATHKPKSAEEKARLLTVLALQGNVSSKNFNETETRGQGTVKLISFFQKVYQEAREYSCSSTPCKMAVLSGGVHILFDGTYFMEHAPGQISTLAFNAENSLSKPPDKKYVASIAPLHFPGTIISIKFPLGQGVTEQI